MARGTNCTGEVFGSGVAEDDTALFCTAIFQLFDRTMICGAPSFHREATCPIGCDTCVPILSALFFGIHELPSVFRLIS